MDGDTQELAGNICSMRGACDTAFDPPFLRVTLAATATTLTTVKVYIPGGYQKTWAKNMDIYAGMTPLVCLMCLLLCI